MKRWKFALERRWFTYLIMATVFAIACVFLSRWQFGRNNETIVANNLLNHNYSAATVPLARLVTGKATYSNQDDWRKVEMTGSYEPSGQLLARDRTLGSNPGFEVLTPFKLDNGRVFIVDRGWVPLGEKQEWPDFIPAPPKGAVHLTARLQASETILPGRVAPAGEISEINLAKMEKLTGISTYTGAYGLLVKETPAPPQRPTALPKPVLDSGPFLSYAFQWILFAVSGFGALFWALREEYRLRNSDDPVEQARAAERARKASLRRPTDAQIEDAQIAAAQHELERKAESAVATEGANASVPPAAPSAESWRDSADDVVLDLDLR